MIGIIIIACLVVLFITGLIMMKQCYDPLDFLGGIAAFGSAILLLIALIALPINYYEVNKDIEKFNATKTTIELSRSTNPELENAAIQHKTVEMNQWLAGIKYDNTVIWDLWIPDEVMALEPIK